MQPYADDRDRWEGEMLLTVAELATVLKVKASWVYAKSKLGEIPTIYVGRYPRFRLRDVLFALDARRAAEMAARPTG